MERVKPVSPWQFACFRIIFGSYLMVHFADLLPYAGELFSGEGSLANPRLNFTFGVLPNPLEHFQSPTFVVSFVAGLCLMSLAFPVGFFRRGAALVLWFGWACLFNRNNLILNPGLPYVGLLLLLSAVIPPGEPLSLGKHPDRQSWQLPAMVYWSAWFLLAAGYTYSGFYKLFSPSWTDGSALLHLLDNPLARPGLFRDLLLTLPPGALKILTWVALTGELVALPFSFYRRGRMIIWLGMLAMHLGILLVVDFADLTFGMLMIHLFTFDPAWLPARKPAGQTVFFFDGDCAFCNRTVQLLLAEDRAGALRFAPLQGSTASIVRQRHNLSQPTLASAILVESFNAPVEKVRLNSDAVLCALDSLGGFWRVVGWLRIVPSTARDAIYDFVAVNRYRWFAEDTTKCIMPEAGVRRRLLA
jgi:predicted DCC family thiol-disulfide oxidoreductase YuxK